MTKQGITASATYYYDLQILNEAAKLLGHTEDARGFANTAAAVKSAFNEKFFDKAALKYDSASQTANAIALFTGLVEPRYRAAVIDALIRDIRSRYNALTAGDIGYRYVIRALQEADRSDIIFAMNNRDDVPGYGYQIRHGATALTESWQALPNVSNNHFMLGHIMEWFYSGIAGIGQAPGSVAYKEIVIKPSPVGDLTSAMAGFRSPYGNISSDWSIANGNFNLDVDIPANTKATIYFPKALVTKSAVKVGSGHHHFEIPVKQ
jgi:hypothetical protein